MFSGIIERIGEVRACRASPAGRSLVIAAEDYWPGTPPGASIAVDGVCLTVTTADRTEAVFDVIAETLRRSTLGELRPGSRVNLQKALVVGDRVDGHFVQGHVDAVGTVAHVQPGPECLWWFELPPEPLACIAPKGSVAIDGISLTVAEVRHGRFSVALIPTTRRETTLTAKRVGDRVNIETDLLARTIVHYLRTVGLPSPPPALDEERLRRAGFM